MTFLIDNNMTPMNTTQSTNITKPNERIFSESIFSEFEQNLITYSFVAITVLGIISNTVVCYLILRYKRLWVIVNILILNLAISDIIACFSVYPFIFLNIHSTDIRGSGANLLCGLTEGLSIFFIGASVSLLTLSVLSISRYLVINHPLKLGWRLEKKSMKYIFTLIWLSSTALLIPSSVSFKYNNEKRFCGRYWAPGVHTLTYFTCTGILGVIIPLTSLTFTYITSMYTLFLKKSVPQNRVTRPTGNLKVKQRVIILLGMLIVVYLICWTPFAIYWLLSVGLDKYSGENEIEGIRISRVAIFIALCQTVLNPIVYAFSNGQLRGVARQSLKLGKTNSVSSVSNGTNLTTFNRRHTFHVRDTEDHEIPFRCREMTL